MRAFSPIVAALAVLAAPASAFAGGAAQNRANPYGSLFAGQLGGISQQAPSAPAPAPSRPFIQTPAPRTNQAPKQTIVCGLTVVQGDATIDSKMPQKLPPNAPKPSIRIVPAPACQK
jgi:hypothetical protein